MSDKRHGKVVLEGDSLVEYAEFYDYSSSYPDAGLYYYPLLSSVMLLLLSRLG